MAQEHLVAAPTLMARLTYTSVPSWPGDGLTEHWSEVGLLRVTGGGLAAWGVARLSRYLYAEATDIILERNYPELRHWSWR